MKLLRILMALCAVTAFGQTPKEALQRLVGTNTINGALASTPFQVATIAALKAVVVTNVPNGTQVYVTGYYASGDCETRSYTYVAASSTANNNGTVIQPTVGGGRWLLNWAGPLSVRWFGAKGDGITDDTTAIQSTLTLGPDVYLPAGTYKVTASLSLITGEKFYGDGPGSILLAGADSINVISATSVANITVSDLSVNGGGQTSDIYTGAKNVIGILFNAVNFFSISNVSVTKCGVVNQAAPTTDGNYGGFGILVEAAAGACGHGIIRNCNVSLIAGGGNFRGDGINVEGQNANPAILTTDITVIACNVTTTGRHGLVVGGGSGGSSVAENIRYISCAVTKTALAGLDIETGNHTTALANHFYVCGNDQTYFNPASAYGATYRLLAGVASDNNSADTMLDRLTVSGCYYGITYGGGIGLTISNTTIDTSTTSDLAMLLGGGPTQFKLSKVTCKTAATFLLQYSTTAADTVVTNCDFAGQPKVSGTAGMVFDTCIFRAGFSINGSGVKNMHWDQCAFLDYAGAGIGFASTSYSATDCAVTDCLFLGTGNMTYGISFQFDDAVRWRITGCLFSGQTTAGIVMSNSNAGVTFVADVSHNTFLSCASGFVVTQQGITNATITGNKFSSITGYCIDFTAINSGGNFTGNNITDNVAGVSVVNGIRINKGTGDGDYNNIIGNNWHACSGTKSNIDITNANGNSAYNIVL